MNARNQRFKVQLVCDTPHSTHHTILAISNQIKSNQIKSNQIKSNQIKSNLWYIKLKSNQINLTSSGKDNHHSGKRSVRFLLPTGCVVWCGVMCCCVGLVMFTYLFHFIARSRSITYDRFKYSDWLPLLCCAVQCCAVLDRAVVCCAVLWSTHNWYRVALMCEFSHIIPYHIISYLIWCPSPSPCPCPSPCPYKSPCLYPSDQSC